MRIKKLKGYKLLHELVMYINSVELFYSKEKCCGCNQCALVCPKEAIKVGPAAKFKEKISDIVKLVSFEMDKEKCVLCGACVAICKTDALKIFVDGKEEIPVITTKTFPKDLEFFGQVRLDTEKCPAGCSTCVDICPEEAFSEPTPKFGEKAPKLVVDEKKCNYCGACVRFCPVDAIMLDIFKVKHSEGFSALLINTLEKIVSKKYLQVYCANLGDKARNQYIKEVYEKCGI
jgi:ferredoxin